MGASCSARSLRRGLAEPPTCASLRPRDRGNTPGGGAWARRPIGREVGPERTSLAHPGGVKKDLVRGPKASCPASAIHDPEPRGGSIPDHRLDVSLEVLSYRGDRTRTCNPRFWRPVLCQLSYAPRRFERTSVTAASTVQPWPRRRRGVLSARSSRYSRSRLRASRSRPVRRASGRSWRRQPRSRSGSRRSPTAACAPDARPAGSPQGRSGTARMPTGGAWRQCAEVRNPKGAHLLGHTSRRGR